AHYTTVGGYGAVGHTTAFWSNGYIANRAGLVRTGFAAYNSFSPDWYTLHPAAWVATGWAANAAWTAATWPSVATFLNITTPPVYLDYGSTIVYQGPDVYVNGTNEGTAEQFNEQAAALAVAGQRRRPRPTSGSRSASSRWPRATRRPPTRCSSSRSTRTGSSAATTTTR